MGLVVNTNITSILARNNLRDNSIKLEQSLERTSTGKRINRSADDAAGLAISTILESQIRGISRAHNNAQDGANLLQIAESSFNIITENLQRMRELVIQGGNDTNSSFERASITNEIIERIRDISNIAESTEYNGISLIGVSAPTATTGYRFTIGPYASDILDISPALGNARATALNSNLVSNVDLTTFTAGDFDTYIKDIDSALQEVVRRRSRLGAFQTQLEKISENLSIININVESANSRIRDVNVAKESSELIKYQVLRNASVSVLMQANQVPKLILSLLSK